LDALFHEAAQYRAVLGRSTLEIGKTMSRKARSLVMPAARVLLLAAVALGAPTGRLLAEEPADTSRSQTVIVPAAGAEASREGTVNLQGFVQPLDSRSLAPMHLTTSIVSPGGLEAGTLSAPSAAAAAGAGGAASKPRGDAGLIGGFAGYRFGEDKNPAAGYGINVQIASDPLATTDNVRLQPGLDYRTFLSPSWQLSSRLFSTYSLDTPAGVTGGRAGLSSSEDASGFRDIGLSFGLGYAPSESWSVQTQAAYARQLRALESESLDGEPGTYQFFGGVIVNYKF
jgi:hypothetical protein